MAFKQYFWKDSLSYIGKIFSHFIVFCEKFLKKFKANVFCYEKMWIYKNLNESGQGGLLRGDFFASCFRTRNCKQKGLREFESVDRTLKFIRTKRTKWAEQGFFLEKQLAKKAPARICQSERSAKARNISPKSHQETTPPNKKAKNSRQSVNF